MFDITSGLGAHEARVRRLASKHGYAVRKSRAHTIHVNDLGDYSLIDVAGNYVVRGPRYDASLEDIEAYLSD